MSPAAAATVASGLPSAGVIVAGALGALLVSGALVVLMRRQPEALPLLVIGTLPFRLPIAADGRTVNLLVPLYLVIVSGVLERLLPGAIPGGGGDAFGDPGAREDRLARYVQWLLLGSVVLYALQAGYSDDRAKALENLAAFYVPFGMLFVLLREIEWSGRLLRRCLGLAVILAVLFAGVGFIEYARKSLFLNPKVVDANQYDNYFRVNSVFFDPSIYGRFLALVMIAVTTVVLWGARREVIAGAVALAWLLAGLVTSFSQSSMVALLLGLAVLAAYRWGVRRTLYVAAGLVGLGLAVLLLAPSSGHFGLNGSKGSIDNGTSGRATLITGGLELFADRPLEGHGSGSFEKEYKAHASAAHSSAENATSASHTIPITVAAEQGIIGLAVYVALLVTALLVLFVGAGRSPPRIAVAAAFAALILHTWTYADFLEDPFTWALLAIGLSLARARPPERAAPQ